MKVELDPESEAVTARIIGAAMAVSNGLGHGFLESVYKRAMIEELKLADLPVRAEMSFPVRYRGKEIGVYVADLVVGDRVIVELKAVSDLSDAHIAQVLNYLRASSLSVGLLMNFGKPRLQWRRVIL